MEYNIKCKVFLGISCEGRYHGDTADIKVNLTDEEARQIREQINPEAESIIDEIQEKLPAVFEKINAPATDYALFVSINDAREYGILEEGVEDDVMKEIENDVNYGGRTLKLYSKEEDEYIKSLSYRDAFNYIYKRYRCECEEDPCIDYDIILPTELRK